MLETEILKIAFSRRNNAKDIWGDDWEREYDKQIKTECEKLVKKFDMGEIGAEDFYSKMTEVRRKYNPYCHKTKSGLPYYSSQFGGNLPPPKLTKQQIAAKIIEIVAKFKINL